ncbi:hypothetical protein PTKU46_83020 [Paraburkholderia terrae]|uniref:hypothetical protein n=1 Tax=Paraburkholderia terrae TaxID=311230 RepID=UPI0030E0C3D5
MKKLALTALVLAGYSLSSWGTCPVRGNLYECVFHTKLDSDFAASWTGISREGGHGFHGKLDSDLTRSWTVTL